MILIFDTSAFSKILSKDAELIRLASTDEFDEYQLPLASDAELRFGFKYGNREASNLTSYESIKQQFKLQIVAPDHDTSLIYADLATWCRQNGVSLSHNDLWVAAAAVQSGGKLLSLDQDFTRLPQLRLVAVD